MANKTLEEVVKALVKAAPELIPSLLKLLKGGDTQTMEAMLLEEHAKVLAQRATIAKLIDEKFPED
jgi:hypothetical protein